MFAFHILAIWTFLFLMYYIWSRRRFYRVAWTLKGPIGLPFIGLGFKMMNPERFLLYMEQISQQYACPFISWMGNKCFLYVNDPVTVETVLNSTHCTNKGDFYRFISTAIGDGLFTSSSPRWNRHRRLINPIFSHQIINNYLPIFNMKANILLERLEQDSAHTGNEMEIFEVLKKIVLETACETTMGKNMNFQHDDSSTIFAAYSDITEVCVTRMLSPWLYPDAIYRRSMLFVREQKVVSILYDFVEQLLHGRNQPNSSVKLNVNETSTVKEEADQLENEQFSTKACLYPKTKSTFIEQVQGYIERGQLTWQDVRDEANVTIAATFETTSTALYFTILCLAMHPDCQDKLYSELLQIFPNINETDFTTHGNEYIFHNITSEHLERMIYTEMVINEAMRLFAPVPMVLRRAEQDFTLPLNGGTVTVPRDTQIGIDIFNMHRNEVVWGPYARCFLPDVHFSSTSNAQRHPFAFIPFTKGLRMCIGYRYALVLMKLLLAKIFRHYRLCTETKMKDLIIKGTISLKLREYPLFKIEKR